MISERGERAVREVFQKMTECLGRGESAVLVTVTAASGSTPRKAGARMLVTGDGLAAGTIGGGAVEHASIELAARLLREGRSRRKHFILTENEAADIGMICGGDTDVYFQYVSGDDGNARRLFEEILAAAGGEREVWLILELTEENGWRMGIFPREGQELPHDVKNALDHRAGEIRAEDGRIFYAEPLGGAGTVYVFGGGHVAQELVPLLAHLGFRCAVMDDREEFSSPERFPAAAETITGDLGEIGRRVRITEKDYVCVMTRGHQFDYLVLRQALKCRPRYIGVMGSRRKIRATAERLLADGFSREEIESCHMPIGTPIGAQTPAEIAVSVAGELIRVRSSKGGGE